MQTSRVPFAGDTITLYNRLPLTDENGKTRLTWQRRVLNNCLWIGRLVGNAERPKSEYVDVSIRIPLCDDFLAYDQWLAAGDRGERFTLAPGDIALLGEVSSEVYSAADAARLLAENKKTGAITVRRVYIHDRAPLGHYRAQGA